MKRMIVLALAGLAWATSLIAAEPPQRLEVPHAESAPFIREILKDPTLVFTNGATWRLRGPDDSIAYQARRYRVYLMPDGSRLEMAGIENRTELNRRDRLRTEVLSGKRPIPITPFPDFYFAFRRTSSNGVVHTVRLELFPKAWLGFVDEPGEVEEKRGGDWVIHIPFSVFVVEADQTRQIQMKATFSLTKLKEIEREEVQEMRHLHKKQTFELYRKGKRIAGQETGDVKGFTHLISGFIVDENQKPIPKVVVLVEWVTDIRYTLFKFKRIRHEKFLKTDKNGYFSFRSTGMWFEFKPYLEGYIPLLITAMPNAMPLTIVMPHIPGDADRLTPRDFLERGEASPFYGGPIRYCPGVGYSLGPENKTAGAPAFGEWTTNREHADLWFYNQNRMTQTRSGVAESNLVFAWTSLVMAVESLNGTEIQVAQQRPIAGLKIEHHLQDAPENGYTNVLSGGFQRFEQNPRRPQKGAFPREVYFRKNGRYGRILDIHFELVKEQYTYFSTNEILFTVFVENIRMQPEIRSNRTLLRQDDFAPYPRVRKRNDPDLRLRRKNNF